MLKEQKGITLVALVITIIVLLILAGVSISLAIGNRGIFTQSKESVNKYSEAQQKENNELENATYEMNTLINAIK